MIQVTIKAIADCLAGDREELPALVERLSAKYETDELRLCFEVAKEVRNGRRAKASEEARALKEAEKSEGRQRRREEREKPVELVRSLFNPHPGWLTRREIFSRLQGQGFTQTQLSRAIRVLVARRFLEERTLTIKGCPKAYKSLAGSDAV